MVYFLDMGCRDDEQTGHGLHRCGTAWTWAIEMRYKLYTAHFQTVLHSCSPCSTNTPSVQPMFSMYLISSFHIQTVPESTAKFQSEPCLTAHNHYVLNLYSPISRWYPNSTAHIQSATYLYSPCPNITTSLQSMSNIVWATM